MSNTTPTEIPAPGHSAAKPWRRHEYLSFRLGQEEYGVDILCVQEIRSFEQPTRMAGSPDSILGVINLRGVIVPIVDMRIKFQLPRVNYDSFTVVIVLNVAQRVVGMVVDAVSDVVTLSPEQLHPAPDVTGVVGEGHVQALGSVAQRMLILLDIEKLLASADLGLVPQPELQTQ